jgi:hypothetical protein
MVDLHENKKELIISVTKGKKKKIVPNLKKSNFKNAPNRGIFFYLLI